MDSSPSHAPYHPADFLLMGHTPQLQSQINRATLPELRLFYNTTIIFPHASAVIYGDINFSFKANFFLDYAEERESLKT